MVNASKNRKALAYSAMIAGLAWMYLDAGVIPASIAVFGLVLWFVEMASAGLGPVFLDGALARGAAAEAQAFRVLKRAVKKHKGKGRVLKNVLIPNPRSSLGSTEVDVAVFTAAGVFIVEVKGHEGTAVADAKAQEWVIYGRHGVSALRNPVRQLNGQIRAMKNFLRQVGVDVPVYGAVFMPNAEIRRRGYIAYPVYTEARFLPAFTLSKQAGEQKTEPGRIVSLLEEAVSILPAR